MTIIKEFQSKIYDDLVNTGWNGKFGFFLKSSGFEDILLELAREKDHYRRFTPAIKDIMKPFRLCYFNDLRLIICRPEPFLNPLLNTGLACECLDPKSYEYQAFEGINIPALAKTGVLWLNTSLTAEIRYPLQHQKIWKPFMNVLLDVLNRVDGLVWVFIGENQYRSRVINKSHKILIRPDLPQIREKWEMDWEEINQALVENNKFRIVLPQCK